jgi:ribulose-phosphate 3-epimerase
MAPSILSADFTRLAEAVAVAERAGADYVHVDVMDGHFVPNLTIGPPVIKALKGITDLPMDVHLMIDNVDDTIGWYLDAGADLVTVHVEACYHLHRVVSAIHEAGARAGVVLNPATPVTTLEAILPDIDVVLLMSVNPGFGGQSFIEHIPGRVARLAAMCDEQEVSPIIEIDGGINEKTAPLVTAPGARMLVAGNAVFGAADPIAALHAIRGAAEGALL